MSNSTLVPLNTEQIGNRLDVVIFNTIHSQYPQFNITRNFVSNNLEEFVRVNGGVKKKGYDIKNEDIIEINTDSLEALLRRDHSIEVIAQEGKLNIVYEDEHILVINKDKGLVVHLGDGNKEGTLVNYLKYYFDSKGIDCASLERCGLVHRLDKGVSGLMIIAKDPRTQAFLKAQFEQHKVIKVYSADIEGDVASIDSSKLELVDDSSGSSGDELVNRHMDKKKIAISDKSVREELTTFIENGLKVDNSWYRVGGYIERDSANRKRMRFKGNYAGNKLSSSESNLSGKYALSYLKFLKNNKVMIKIETGRMHQIRATLKFLGLVIKGDSLYANSSGKNSSMISLEAGLLALNINARDFKIWKLI